MQCRLFGDTAIISYGPDETEDVLGQHLTARYHGTWQIVASQILRYYEDPPSGLADPARFPDYVTAHALGRDRRMKVATDGAKLDLERGKGHAKNSSSRPATFLSAEASKPAPPFAATPPARSMP